jgi:hypothetical protein
MDTERWKGIMDWELRVVKRYMDVPMGRGKRDWFYGIYEVLLNEDGKILCMGLDPIAPLLTEFEALRGDVVKMLDAFGKPVLEWEGM